MASYEFKALLMTEFETITMIKIRNPLPVFATIKYISGFLQIS
jgi:hypothetical protein